MTTLTITKENFQREVLESGTPVLLDFWASWCGPCRMLSPVIDEIASEVSSVKVGKINVDEQPELAQSFNVMSIPTLVLMKEGKISDKTMGAQPKANILKFIGN
ncbi:MAG: thioredoxin [Clostridia bacterium]|nr:thioredoxin [Clostridia bacterium]MDD4798899.1 thioredoxin [Clostridia bacterium]